MAQDGKLYRLELLCKELRQAIDGIVAQKSTWPHLNFLDRLARIEGFFDDEIAAVNETELVMLAKVARKENAEILGENAWNALNWNALWMRTMVDPDEDFDFEWATAALVVAAVAPWFPQEHQEEVKRFLADAETKSHQDFAAVAKDRAVWERPAFQQSSAARQLCDAWMKRCPEATARCA